MISMIRTLTLASVIGALAIAPLATNAQEKKTTAKKGAGIIQIQEGRDGKFRFMIRNSENKYLAGSLGYETKADAQKAVEELKGLIDDAKIVNLPKAQPKNDDGKAKAKDAKEKAPSKNN